MFAGRSWDDPATPLVALDLASVTSYLLVQPLAWLALEQREALWCPLTSGPAALDHDSEEARRFADSFGLPLTLPGRHPARVVKAMRVAALASDRGRGMTYMFGLSRAAFGSGKDIDDPAEYMFAAGEAGLSMAEAAQAAEPGSAWDDELHAIAHALELLGVASAPAMRWKGTIHVGIEEILLVLAQRQSWQSHWS